MLSYRCCRPGAGIGAEREQDERRRTRARVARTESVEVISKVEGTTVPRSLHRMVRSLWVFWRPWCKDLSGTCLQILTPPTPRTYSLLSGGNRHFVRQVSQRNFAF